MHRLTPADVAFYNSLTFLFVLGVLFFIVAFFVMMFMFAWTYKDVMKHGKRLLVMLLLSLSIPFTVGAITQQTNMFSNASSAANVSDIQVQRVQPDTVVVQFTTSEPVIAYLEYQNKENQTVPVLPTGSRDADTNHYFRVTDTAGDNGVVYIVINGSRFTINGEPIKITQ
jgi:hypothetical protein